jgi:glycosyltransferase involved in cell wall biosynthesis
VCHISRVPDPFGLVVIEAMTLERAVIVTRGGSPSEIFADETQGMLVSADDPPALAAAMTALIDDPERRRRMGRSALERVKQSFTIETMPNNLLAHLDSVEAR